MSPQEYWQEYRRLPRPGDVVFGIIGAMCVVWGAEGIFAGAQLDGSAVAIAGLGLITQSILHYRDND